MHYKKNHQQSPPEPSVPVNVKAESKGGESVSVTWDPPTSVNGVIDYYSVSTNDGSDNVIVRDSTQTMLTGLSSCTDYGVTVMAVNAAGTGDYSDVASVTTGDGSKELCF